jgi:hypothetical protein
MTATTYTNIPGAKPGASLGGRLGRFFWRIIDAQEQRIAKRVGKILNTYDDAYLAKIGYIPAEIAQLRQKNRTR